jgi:hypothetical protein
MSRAFRSSWQHGKHRLRFARSAVARALRCSVFMPLRARFYPFTVKCRFPSLAATGLGFLLASFASASALAQPSEEAPPAPAEAAPPAAAEAAPPAEAPPVAVEAEAPPPPPADKPKPPPYSLPFQLRPVAPGNVIRSDTTLALYKNAAGASGNTVASTLLASYKVTDDLAPLIRLGIVSNSPPTGPSGSGFLNPVLGALYGIKVSPELKLGLFLGLALPIGSGGGNSSDPENRAANGAGILARAAMDNAMFAVNDFTVFPGVGFAYVSKGFTAQVEATVLQLTRVKGDAFAPDKSRTNFTTGLHLGYFLIPMLSVGAELRHQRWLSTPKALAVATNSALRDNTTVAFGPRVHLKLSPTIWLRPAITFAMPLDDPMKAAKYKLFQLDLPFVF